jgi:hypothetical protein
LSDVSPVTSVVMWLGFTVKRSYAALTLAARLEAEADEVIFVVVVVVADVVAVDEAKAAAAAHASASLMRVSMPVEALCHSRRWPSKRERASQSVSEVSPRAAVWATVRESRRARSARLASSRSRSSIKARECCERASARSPTAELVELRRRIARRNDKLRARSSTTSWPVRCVGSIDERRAEPFLPLAPLPPLLRAEDDDAVGEDKGEGAPLGSNMDATCSIASSSLVMSRWRAVVARSAMAARATLASDERRLGFVFVEW